MESSYFLVRVMTDGSWKTKVTQSISEEKEEVSHQDEDPDVLHHLWIV